MYNNVILDKINCNNLSLLYAYKNIQLNCIQKIVMFILFWIKFWPIVKKIKRSIGHFLIIIEMNHFNERRNKINSIDFYN